jgi:hypothetical protein
VRGAPRKDVGPGASSFASCGISYLALHPADRLAVDSLHPGKDRRSALRRQVGAAAVQRDPSAASDGLSAQAPAPRSLKNLSGGGKQRPTRRMDGGHCALIDRKGIHMPISTSASLRMFASYCRDDQLQDLVIGLGASGSRSRDPTHSSPISVKSKAGDRDTSQSERFGVTWCGT